MQFNSKFTVIVHPNSAKNELIRYDKEKNVYHVRIKAQAEKGKANKELIKFLSKVVGKRVLIKSGLKSREKLIYVCED